MVATARTSRVSRARTSNPIANQRDPFRGVTHFVKTSSDRIVSTFDEEEAALAEVLLIPLTSGNVRISSTVGYFK